MPFRSPWHAGPVEAMPKLPDHWEVIEEADAAHPFRLATSPARNFLNSTFNETPISLTREGRPQVMMHPDDAAAHGIADGDKVVLGNVRGEVRLHAQLFDGVRRGVLIAESIWPNSAFEDGRGINTLTGADAIAPSAALPSTITACGSGWPKRRRTDRRPAHAAALQPAISVWSG